jgi:histidinol-phosphate/aromatic aminotransferase/cobyric acid decarboxylase-like protein
MYPATKGSDDLRLAISQWLTGRFDINADPMNQILPVYGTREALFAVAQALLSGKAGSLVGMPNPFYQIYEGAALLAGATPLYIPNPQDQDYRSDFSCHHRRSVAGYRDGLHLFARQPHWADYVGIGNGRVGKSRPQTRFRHRQRRML